MIFPWLGVGAWLYANLQQTEIQKLNQQGWFKAPKCSTNFCGLAKKRGGTACSIIKLIERMLKIPSTSADYSMAWRVINSACRFLHMLSLVAENQKPLFSLGAAKLVTECLKKEPKASNSSSTFACGALLGMAVVRHLVAENGLFRLN